METLWFFIVSVMLAVYVVLDGFDFGAGILLLFVARTDPERREVFAAIGPFWDGNEVWLIAGGGTLFLAFPRAYAVGFSGFYLPLMLVLWLLILRGVSMELRSHHANPLWRQLWDFVLAFACILIAVVLGAALGNVLRGVPIDGTGYFEMGLFATGANEIGVLDLYTVIVGVFTLSLLALHGALYLSWKTAGELQSRCRKAVWIALTCAIPLGVVSTLMTARVRPELYANLLARPFSWPAVLLVGIAAIALPAAHAFAKELLAFLSSALLIAGLLAASAAGVFPVMLRSTISPSYSLDMHNSAAAEHGLRTGLVWFCIALPLAAGYFIYLFRSFRGKARVSDPHAEDAEG